MTQTPGIDPEVPPSGDGCAECLAATPSGWWFHLRRCAGCGHVGCCDSSPGRHARSHFERTGHRYVRTFEPEEDWFWDYRTEDYYDGPQLAPPQHHPVEQPAPGPDGAVPAHWTRYIRR